MDYIGIALVVVGVGFLQYFLDKGEELDWFANNLILVSFIIAVVCLVGLVIRELTHEDPIIDLRLLGIRNFGIAVTFSFILGVILNGSTILIPQFLQNSLGYTAERAGLAMSPGGIALAILMPVAGILTTKFDPRLIIAIGFSLMSFGLFHVTGIYLGIDFSHMVWFRVIQVIGLPLIFIPISTLNYVGVPQNKRNQVAGISNFLRNIGGAVGVSLLNNFLSRSSQVNTNTLVAHAQKSNPFFMRQLNAMTANFARRRLQQSRGIPESTGPVLQPDRPASRRPGLRKRLLDHGLHRPLLNPAPLHHEATKQERDERQRRSPLRPAVFSAPCAPLRMVKLCTQRYARRPRWKPRKLA